MSLKQPLTEIQAEVHLEEWYQMAMEFGFSRFASAVRGIMREHTDWFPSVKQIRETLSPVGEKRDKAEAEIAWQKIMEHFYTCDECEFYHFDNKRFHVSDRAMGALGMIGGTERIIHTTIADLHWVHDKFIEAWETAGDEIKLHELGSGERGGGMMRLGEIPKTFKGMQ